MIDLPNFVYDLLHKIAKDEGFTEYTLKFESGTKQGENLAGVLTSVTVSGLRNVNGTNANDTLNLLCKLPPSSASQREAFHSIQFFEREVYIYNKCLPLFANFQREKGITDADLFQSYPKCYAAIADQTKDEYVVIMRDLRPDGFVMRPRGIVAPADHFYRIIGELAKLHGISFALKDQRPAVYNELKQATDFFRHFFGPGSPMRVMLGFDRAIAALKNKDHINIVEDLKANVTEYFEDCLGDNVCEPFGVLSHADCHNNNLLFLYENEANNLKDICLLDWQLSSFRSPVIDILYMFLNFTDKTLRDKEYNNLLKHYHGVLSETITKLGSDAERLFSYEDLESQLKKFGKFAFVTGPLSIQLTLANPEHLSNLDDVTNDIEKSGQCRDFIAGFDQKTQVEYDQRINDLFSDLLEYGYYWK